MGKGENKGKKGAPGWQKTDKSKSAGKTPPEAADDVTTVVGMFTASQPTRDYDAVRTLRALIKNDAYWNSLSEESLEAIIVQVDRQRGDDCEWAHNNLNDEDECPACKAREVRTRRRYIDESKQEGADPCIYIPGVQSASFRNIRMSELKEGMVTTHNPMPGKKTRTYVEAIQVEQVGDMVNVRWRVTNPRPENMDNFIHVTYRENDYMDISEIRPLI